MNPAPLGEEEYERMRETGERNIMERLLPSGPAKPKSLREQAPFSISAKQPAYIKAADAHRQGPEAPLLGSDAEQDNPGDNYNPSEEH